MFVCILEDKKTELYSYLHVQLHICLCFFCGLMLSLFIAAVSPQKIWICLKTHSGDEVALLPCEDGAFPQGAKRCDLPCPGSALPVPLQNFPGFLWGETQSLRLSGSPAGHEERHFLQELCWGQCRSYPAVGGLFFLLIFFKKQNTLKVYLCIRIILLKMYS